MAKYTVTYKCGHTAEVQLYGKEAERQRKIAWYATIDCPDCEAGKQREKAEKAGLPQLTGSEKQIAWATKIRNQALDAFNEKMPLAPEQKRATLEGYRDQWIAKEISSSYWIDSRWDATDYRSVVGLIIKSLNLN